MLKIILSALLISLLISGSLIAVAFGDESTTTEAGKEEKVTSDTHPARSRVVGAILIFITLLLMILAIVLSFVPYFVILEQLYEKKWIPTGETMGTIATIPVGNLIREQIQAEQKAAAAKQQAGAMNKSPTGKPMTNKSPTAAKPSAQMIKNPVTGKKLTGTETTTSTYNSDGSSGSIKSDPVEPVVK